MQNTCIIKLDSVDKVKSFVNKIATVDGDFVIKSTTGPYVIDAKSIMGIFSLDLSTELAFGCKDATKDIPEAAIKVIESYIVK